MDLGLASRGAIVTGAGRGIGRQVALDLAAAGCNVVAVARTRSSLESVAAESAEADHEGRIVPLAIDLSEAGSESEIVGAAGDEFGRLDIVINNAGGPQPSRLERMTDDKWRAGFEVDFFAAARLSVAAVEPMRSGGWGRIVNVASTYGREPDPAYAAYGAAKAALINLTKSFARAYSAEGIMTNCVVPGVTMTEGVVETATAAAEKSGKTMDEILELTMQKDPVAAGRFGETPEISAAILFLASEQASWISGSCLAVDGSTLRVAP